MLFRPGPSERIRRSNLERLLRGLSEVELFLDEPEVA